MDMKFSGFYSLFIIVTSGVMLATPMSSDDDYSVTVNLSTEIAMQGDSLTAVCNVTTEVRESLTFFWVKKTVDDDQLVEITTNKYLNENFEKTGRYRADHTIESAKNSTRVIFRLHISDLKSEDSGLITCKGGNTKPKDFKPFMVQVPVQKIWWTSFDDEVPLSDGEIVTIKEGDNHTFECNVDGSYPLAVIQVFSGGQDITHLFEVTSSLRKGHGSLGLQPLYYYAKAISRLNIIGYHNMTKPLKCVAKLPNSDLSATTTINVNMTEYSPTFLCEDKMPAKLHETWLNLSCRVHANPGVKLAKFAWISENDNNNNTLDAGEKTSDISAEMSQGDDKDEVIMVLTISRVTSQHFERKYIFEAQNDIKRVKHVIQLEKVKVVGTSDSNTLAKDRNSFHILKMSLLQVLLSCFIVFIWP